MNARLSRIWPNLIVVASLSFTLTLGFNNSRSESDTRGITYRTQTMGTWASLILVTADSAAVADLAYDALLVLHRVDSLMSNWTDVSEVARINRDAAANEIAVHPEVAEVLGFSQQVSQQSEGAFDITVEPLVRLWGFLGGEPRVPAEDEIAATLELVGSDKWRYESETATIHFVRDGVRIDFGGIAKGYGVDQVAEILREANVRNALVDLSGNMVALGDAAGKSGWTLGIRDPSGDHPYIARVRISDEAVATSGDYEQFVNVDGERYGHILDPRSGWSAQGLSSVTVVADHAMKADAWATALFVLGSETARQIAHERSDLAVVLLEPQESGKDIIWVEEQLRSRFELEDALKEIISVIYF